MNLVEHEIVETVSNVYRRLKCQDADSIGYGGLGRLFLSVELYRYTGDKKIKKDILNSLQKAEQYRKSVRSNNYSLFNGRSGLSYYYLECFKLTNDEIFLAKGIEIAKEYVDSASYPFRCFDHSGLVNGTAGMLIFYLSLYKETGGGWIKEFIGQCMSILMEQANLTETGLYWNGIYRTDLQPGWAHGGHGIAFCLSELGRHFKNEHLLSVAELAIKEEDQLRRPYSLSFGNGIVGEALVKLYFSTHDHNAQYEAEWKKVARLLDGVLTGDFKDIPADVFNGLAGWSLAFYEAHMLTKDHEYLNSAQNIASILYERLLHAAETNAMDESFFSGVSGICYSLLKITGDYDSPSLVLPRLTDNASAGNINTSKKTTDLISLSEMNRQLLRNNFGETTMAIEKEFPRQLNEILSFPSIISLSAFKKSVGDLIGNPSDGLQERLLEKAELDIVIIGLKREVFKYLPDREGDLEKKIDAVSRLDNDGILGLRVAVSEKIFIWSKEDAIDYSRPLTESFLINELPGYGERSYYIWHDGFSDFGSFKLREKKILADLFIRPNMVSAALNELLDFVMRHDDQFVRSFIRMFNAKDKDQLKWTITVFFLRATKMMLLEGILEVHDFSI